jgi:transposase-like protein
MGQLRCKRCGSAERTKNGFMRGKQRYRCKACGLNFTDTPPRGMPLQLKVTAILLYVSGLSMNRTAKLLGVSTPSVMAWIEQFAKDHAQKPEPEGRAPRQPLAAVPLGTDDRLCRSWWSSWMRCGIISKKGQQALGVEGLGSCFGPTG